MTGAADSGLTEVLRQLTRRGAGGFEWYKESCLLRRIEVRMRARGVPSMLAYSALLEEPEEMERLLRSLSVRVTGFFRNPDTWSRLFDLLASERTGSGGRLTAWSMGCSTGEEGWSLAMLLLAHSRRSGGNPSPAAIRVLASDVDSQALAVAEAGIYPAAPATAAIREVLAESWGRIDDGRFEVGPEARGVIRFRREDLTAPAPRSGWYDLVTCRNLLIFLGGEGQRRVLLAAHQALRPGGLLLLGRTESLISLPELKLAPVDISHRIYRKVS